MGTNGKIIREELIRKGCREEQLDSLLRMCLWSLHKPSQGNKKKELDWLKGKLDAQIHRLEDLATEIADLDKARFDDVPLTGTLDLIKGIVGARSGRPPTFPPEDFFQGQAANIRACSADLRRLRDHIARHLGFKNRIPGALMVFYAYCCVATQSKVSPQDIADILEWAKLNMMPNLRGPMRLPLSPQRLKSGCLDVGVSTKRHIKHLEKLRTSYTSAKC
jgi:hypothetical protein